MITRKEAVDAIADAALKAAELAYYDDTEMPSDHLRIHLEYFEKYFNAKIKFLAEMEEIKGQA